MNDYGKSDNSIVPETFPNKTPRGVAEEMEERGLAKGNLHKQNVSRTQGRTNTPSAFERVRQAARTLWRYYLRQEPGAGIPHAGICAGGAR